MDQRPPGAGFAVPAAPSGAQQQSLPPLLGQGGNAAAPFSTLPQLNLFPPANTFRPPPAGAAQYYTQQQSMLTPSPARNAPTTGPPRSGGGASKKQCNCKNSRCLKLYCECFASGRYCDSCNCVNCFNNRENEGTRQSAVEAILERNPNAFRPKIQGSEAEAAIARTVAADGLAPRHTKGCNCKKSTCLKKYCECFQAGIFCSDICKCMDCKNYDGSEARAQVMAVQEMGSSLSASMSVISPSKRARHLQQQQQPHQTQAQQQQHMQQALHSQASLQMQLQQQMRGPGGIGGPMAPAPHVAPGPGPQQQQSRQSTFQQVVSELVRPSIIEELCRLLFMAADDEEDRLTNPGHQQGPVLELGAMPSANGRQQGEEAMCMVSPSQLYEAQERVVLDEFNSILRKIVDTAAARTTERQQQQLQQQQQQPSSMLGPASAGPGMMGTAPVRPPAVLPVTTGMQAPRPPGPGGMAAAVSSVSENPAAG